MKKGAQATAAAAATRAGHKHSPGSRSGRQEDRLHRRSAKRELGKTGVELPMLGYGGAALPKKWGNTLSDEDRVKLVRHAYDSGIRYFDTAISLHLRDSQAIIGEASEGRSRQRLHHDQGRLLGCIQAGRDDSRKCPRER